jgi:hypothetical protein
MTPTNARLFGLDELQPQLPDGLRVDLAHAGLGDAEDLADLGQGESLEVVERDHDLLALGQRVDRGGEQPARLLSLEPGGRIGATVGERVEQRDLLPAVAADAQDLVELQDLDERDLVDDLVQLGTQSIARSSSMIAPLMRGIAYVSNLLPRAGSNFSSASISPNIP